MTPFREIIRIIGVNPYVSVPLRVSRSFNKKGYIPVAVKINGHDFPATLVPVGSGRHRLYLHGEMRKKAQAQVGDSVTVFVKLDKVPRMPLMSKPLAQVMKAQDRKVWDGLIPSRKKEILRYLGRLKSKDALNRNLERVLKYLRRDGTWFNSKI